jgi:hypothetical protein
VLREGPHPSFHGRPLDRAMLWDTANDFALDEPADAVFLAFAR